MVDERKRVITRREPIVTVVTVDGADLRFEAYEIPKWRARNDFADFVVKQYLNAMNEWVHAIQTDDAVLLEGSAFESVMDYKAIFEHAYPNGDVDDFEQLDFDSMIEVLKAALEVNGLQRQAYMLERKDAPKAEAASSASPSDADGQKTESSAVSG